MTHNILSLLSLLALAGCGQAPAGAAAQPRPVKPLVVGTPAAPVWSNCSKAKAARPARLPTPT